MTIDLIIIDRLTNVTVGAGMIVGTVSDNKSNWESDTRSEFLKSSDSLISTTERYARLGQKPKTLLLTGLTGSGKSTIAYALERKLFDLGRTAIVLDGQNMRLGPSKDLGFDTEARSENLRRSIEIAKLMNQAGMIAICSFVAPSKEVRQKARESVGNDFIEVYLSAPLEVCRNRDQEGIYNAIESEGLETVPGVNLPYDTPERPDVVLPTHEISIEDCVERLVKELEERDAF